MLVQNTASGESMMSRAIFGSCSAGVRPWSCCAPAPTPTHRICVPAHLRRLSRSATARGETGPALIGSGFQQRWGRCRPSDLMSSRVGPCHDARGLELTRIMCRAHPHSSMPTAGWCHRLRRPRGHQRAFRHGGVVEQPRRSGSASYSSLDQINRDNVARLRIAWR